MALRRALLRWTIVLPYIMRAHLLDYSEEADLLDEVLTDDEAEWLRQPPEGLHAHQPMRAAGAPPCHSCPPPSNPPLLWCSAGATVWT
jgi:hypothetical protein